LIPPVTDEPIDVIIVASWFPAYDGLADGRFVADQAEALLATGAARPFVITFDGVRLTGGATARGRQEHVVVAATRAAAASVAPLFVAPARGVDPELPVARLAIAEGQSPGSRTVHAAIHREVVLRAAAERLRAGGVGNGIVHAHTVYPDGAAAARLAEQLGWPLVITEHSSFVDKIIAAPGPKERYAAAVGKAARVFAVSEMLAGELRAAFPELADRFHVLPNSVPVDLFRASPLSERRVDELLFVGNRKASKGIENLLRAVVIARAERPTVTLRLLGRSPDEATEAGWRSLAVSLGIAEAVSFEEPVDRAGIADAMARASLFVHPSPRETFGVVAVEALASGTPVVATDSGGVTEILGDDPERLGAVVPTDDAEALGRAIVAALERRADFDPAGLRASVERRFGSAYVAERLLVVYRELLANAPAEPGAIPPAEAQVPPPGPVVVVALDRERAAQRLRPLPDGLRESLTLVTGRAPAEIALPNVRRVVEVDIEPVWRPNPSSPAAIRRSGVVGRLARLASDPKGTIERRLGRGSGSEAALSPAVEALRAHLAEHPDVGVLPLDGHDHLVASKVGAPIAAGGSARRLADLGQVAGLAGQSRSG
jgi:glycosyltransferase involved in cell wall biosynthesis